MLRLLIIAGLAMASPLFALENPLQDKPKVFGDGLGMHVRMGGMGRSELAELEAMGVTWLRIGLSWNRVEQEPGVLRWDRPLPRDWNAPDIEEWPRTSHNGMIQAARDHNLKVLVQLGWPSVSQTHAVDVKGKPVAGPPVSERERRGFATYAAATAKHFSDQYGTDAFIWSIWNEPDLDANWPPKADGHAYGELLKDTCVAIKLAVPQAKVIGPSMAGTPDNQGFLATMLETEGLLDCLDGISAHPYRATPPETAPKDYATMRAMIARASPRKPHLPLLVDEWGYSLTELKDKLGKPFTKWRSYTQEEQAGLMLRSYLANLADGVPLTVLYNWRNDAPLGNDPYEAGFGFKTYDNKDKPALRMLRHVGPLLKGRPYEGNKVPEACSGRLFAYQFGGRGMEEAPVWILGTIEHPTLVNLEHAVDVTGLSGKKYGKRSQLALRHEPVAVEGTTNLPKIRCRALDGRG